MIRGLDGDRVLILEDGQRIGDLSSQSGDHGVTVNPAAATRIEVVRGPATLLYGSNAIGGLVNVITEVIPAAQSNGAHGDFTFDCGFRREGGRRRRGLPVGNGRWAVHVGGSGRRPATSTRPRARSTTPSRAARLRQRRSVVDR